MPSTQDRYGAVGIRTDVEPIKPLAPNHRERRAGKAMPTSRDEGEAKSVNLLELDASAEKVDGFYEEFAVDKDIRVGSTLSASLDGKVSNTDDIFQVFIDFYNSTPALISSHGGEFINDTTYVRRVSEFVVVPPATDKVRVRAGYVGSVSGLLAQDTFTNPGGGNVNLENHTPDLILGGWEHSGTVGRWVVLPGDSWRLDNDVSGLPRFARSEVDIADDNFEIYQTISRSHAGDEGGVAFLLNKNTAVANGHGCALFTRSSGPSILTFERRDSAGTVVQSATVDAAFPIGVGLDHIIGVQVSGLTVTPFRQTAAGVRTFYSPITLGADLRDGNHRRVGMYAKAQPSFGPFGDNLNVKGIVNLGGFFGGLTPRGTVTTQKAMLNQGPKAIPFRFPLIEVRATNLAVNDLLAYDGNFFVNVQPAARASLPPEIAYEDEVNIFTLDQVIGVIRRDTVDGADNKTLFLTGGGSSALDASRGAGILLGGNEATGQATIQSGTNFNVLLRSGSGGASVTISPTAAAIAGIFSANGAVRFSGTATHGTSGTIANGSIQVLADATAGAITLTLPANSGILGQRHYIKKTDSSSNVVTVSAGVGDNIDGLASIQLTQQGDNVLIVSGLGSGNWHSFAGSAGGGSPSLGSLSDVTLTSPATGHYLEYNGTEWVNRLGVDAADVQGVLTKTQLPAAIAYEDEANVFTVGQTISAGGIDVTGTSTFNGAAVSMGALTATTGAFSGVVTITRAGADLEILRFDTERPWSFFQRSTGATTELDLRSATGGKTFRITNTSGESVARFFAGDAASANNVVEFAEGRVVISDAGAISGDSTLQIDGNTLLGTTTPATGSPRLDVVGLPTLTGANVTTDATDKAFHLTVRHRTNAEETVMMLRALAQTAANVVEYGGGSGAHNAATVHNWYTAATTTTVTGTLAMDLTGVGSAAILRSAGHLRAEGEIRAAGGIVDSVGAVDLLLKRNAVTKLTLASASATFADIGIFPTATTSAASIRLPHGSAPTTPTNGDIWTTVSSVFARVNGATIDLGAGGGGGLSGSGTANTVAKWTGASSLGDSSITEASGVVSIVNAGNAIFQFHPTDGTEGIFTAFAVPATAGSTLKHSPDLRLLGQYWNSVSMNSDTWPADLQHVMLTTSPTSRVVAKISSVEILSWASGGGLHIGSGYTAPPAGGLRTEGDLFTESGVLNSAAAVDLVLKRNATTKVTVTSADIDFVGAVDSDTGFKKSGTQVVGAQGAAVSDVTGGTVIDAEARTAINALLARVRAHGLIAT